MTLRQEMHQAARLAPDLLGGHRDAVAAFLRSHQTPDGGFRGRAEQSDLYYTVFALDGLAALEADFSRDAAARYLASFAGGEELDLVHLACLARCWAALDCGLRIADCGSRNREWRETLLGRIETHRSADGGYAPTPGAEHGTAYACFLALGAVEDLGATVEQPEGIIRCLSSLRRGDGGIANECGLRAGSTPATAAALTILHHLGGPTDDAARDWLLARVHPQGGFAATAAAPVPDLLSTGTALHALAGIGAPLAHLRAPCLDFVEGLWADEGGFRGTWLDDAPDAEYTFYALLALGHLAQ